MKAPSHAFNLGLDGDIVAISGYAATFGPIDRDGDSIAPGAFGVTLAAASANPNRWPRMLLEHGDFKALGDVPVGAWTEIVEDDHGLFVQGNLHSGTIGGREALGLLAMGALFGLSVSFNVLDADRNSGGPAKRVIREALLREISLVQRPQNRAAVISSAKVNGKAIISRDTSRTGNSLSGPGPIATRRSRADYETIAYSASQRFRLAAHDLLDALDGTPNVKPSWTPPWAKD